MGVSSTGLLVYGYDLGGVDAEWTVQEADDYGAWRPAWFTAGQFAALDDGSLDIGEALAERLRFHSVRGVEVLTYGHYSSPGYMLAMECIKAYQGTTKPVHGLVNSKLETPPLAIERMGAALKALQVSPVQDGACWLLTVLYG